MKTIVLITMLMAAVPASAANYYLSLPSAFKTDVAGVRDFQNGQWLSGYEIDAVWLRRSGDPKPIAYLAGNQLFNANEKGKGSLGLSLGLTTGKVAELIEGAAEILMPSHAHRFAWMKKASNWVTIEVAGGYRLFGAQDELSPWVWGLGGKVRVPIEKLWSWK